MAKRVRYEFTQGWLAETQFRRVRGLDNPYRARYTAATLAKIEESYYEQLYREREQYNAMESRNGTLPVQ